MKILLLPLLALTLWTGTAHAQAAEPPADDVCVSDDQCGRWKACFTGRCVSKHTATGGKGLLIGGYVTLGVSLLTAAAAIILTGPTFVLSLILGIPVALTEFAIALPLIIAGHIHRIRWRVMLKASADVSFRPAGLAFSF
jgi:hypothetical protein